MKGLGIERGKGGGEGFLLYLSLPAIPSFILLLPFSMNIPHIVALLFFFFERNFKMMNEKEEKDTMKMMK